MKGKMGGERGDARSKRREKSVPGMGALDKKVEGDQSSDRRKKKTNGFAEGEKERPRSGRKKWRRRIPAIANDEDRNRGGPKEC